MSADSTLQDSWLTGRWACEHGTHCSCRLLTMATGADSSAIDYNFCRTVLQKRWRMECDHVPHVSRPRATPKLPPYDSRDPIHALLIANAYATTE